MRSKKRKEGSTSVPAVIQRAFEPLKCEESGKKEALLSRASLQPPPTPTPLKKIKVINLTTTDKSSKVIVIIKEPPLALARMAANFPH